MHTPRGNIEATADQVAAAEARLDLTLSAAAPPHPLDDDPTLLVVCDQCGGEHTGHYSHDDRWNGRPVFAVVCPVDDLTDYYTGAAAVVR